MIFVFHYSSSCHDTCFPVFIFLSLVVRTTLHTPWAHDITPFYHLLHFAWVCWFCWVILFDTFYLSFIHSHPLACPRINHSFPFNPFSMSAITTILPRRFYYHSVSNTDTRLLKASRCILSMISLDYLLCSPVRIVHNEHHMHGLLWYL